MTEDMRQMESMLQFQLDEERLRASQLYNEKRSLEQQVKELAVKLSGMSACQTRIATNTYTGSTLSNLRH